MEGEADFSTSVAGASWVMVARLLVAPAYDIVRLPIAGVTSTPGDMASPGLVDVPAKPTELIVALEEG